MCRPTQRIRSWMPILAAMCLVAPGSARADTIFLRDGTQIFDCKVTEETETHVFVTTPVGDMGVPRTEILRIQRVRTVHDDFADQLAALREGDVAGLFKLATWCRTTAGLRKESDELLSKVIELQADHSPARKLLGHVRVGKEWVAPPPLSLRLKPSGKDAKDLRRNLELLLKTRGDVTVEPEDPKAAAVDSLDHCTLTISVVLSRKAGSAVYGRTVGMAFLGATVRFQAQAKWIGSTVLKTTAEGQVPAAGGDPSVAIQNALGSSSANVNRFLDSILELRGKKLAEERRKAGQKLSGR